MTAGQQPARPSLARKQTRTTRAKTASILDEGVKLVIDKEVFEVRIGDLNATDVRELRKQLGLSFTGLMTTLNTDPDLDLIAAIVWLARRIKGERGLTYDEVADEMGFEVMENLELVEDAGPEETDPNDPEA